MGIVWEAEKRGIVFLEAKMTGGEIVHIPTSPCQKNNKQR